MISKKLKYILWVCFLFPAGVFALGATKVSIEADQYAEIGVPVEVSILVTHEKSDKVDVDSFKSGDQRLVVNFVRQIPMSETSDLVISVYKYTIQPEKRGSHTIPSVSVKVGGKVYTSYEGNYNVL